MFMRVVSNRRGLPASCGNTSHSFEERGGSSVEKNDAASNEGNVVEDNVLRSFCYG